MKKILLSLAVVAIFAAATACSKEKECTCVSSSGVTTEKTKEECTDLNTYDTFAGSQVPSKVCTEK